MQSPNPLDPQRVRKIQGSFSWIDHRFITGGFLEPLTPLEILLYFFLVAVGDRQGLSFYHDDRIGRLLKIDLVALGNARRGLIEQSLLAYDSPSTRSWPYRHNPSWYPRIWTGKKPWAISAGSGRCADESGNLGTYSLPLCY